jgi:Flp pilus assembly protein TadB
MTAGEGAPPPITQIEQRLAQEEPELAEDMRRWRVPRGARVPWAARLLLGGGVVIAVVAVLLASMGWALLAALTLAVGWCSHRLAHRQPVLPERRAMSDRFSSGSPT